jgi:hypothetical protein
MNKITEFIETTVYDYKSSHSSVDEKRKLLRKLTSVIFKEVFDICWKYTDNDTLELIMNDIDKIKEENNLPI